MSTPGNGKQIGELLARPLEELLVALGSGIGQSQAELDRHSIEIQRLIDEDPVLAQHGLEATWFQIPTTEVEVKVAVAMERETSATAGGLGDGAVKRPRLWVQPVNPTVANLLGFDVQAASVVKLNVVAVPPPAGAQGAATTTAEEAIAAAKLPERSDLRLTANYNPGVGAWFVRQTDESVTPSKLVNLVRVDGDTLAVVWRVKDGEPVS